MTFNNKLVRHWFGFAHGWLAMLGVAWIYEGKCGIGQQTAYFVLPLLMGVLACVLVITTGASIVKEIEK